jgi:hypothetical protein
MNQKIYKVNISEDANKKIESMLEDLGKENTIKINKQKLLSWIIIQYEKTQFQKSKVQIQKDHFNNVEYLNSVLKKIKNTENQDEALKEYLKVLILKKPKKQANKESLPGSKI